MYNDKIVAMIVRQHNVQKIAIKQLKVKSIHKDIIRLKQENRNIGDKIKSLYRNISTNTLKLIDCSETAGYTYNDRVMRDHTTIGYLEKLQMINSMRINKHRSKVRALKKELSALHYELHSINLKLNNLAIEQEVFSKSAKDVVEYELLKSKLNIKLSECVNKIETAYLLLDEFEEKYVND